LASNSTKELIEEGMKLMKEQRPAEAYSRFKEATSLDPGNEWAWVWVSATSKNRAEQRNALERALEINPNNQHAKEAMRALEAQETVQTSVPAGRNARIGQTEVNTTPSPSDLRAALSSQSGKKGKKAAKTTTKNQQMVSQQPSNRVAARRIRLAILLILVVGVTIAVVYLVLQRVQGTTTTEANLQPTVATSPGGTVTTDANTPIVVATTAAAASAAAAGTPLDVSATAITPGTLTPATTAETTSATTTVGTPGSGTPGSQTLPAGSSEAAQIAKALQTARDSQAAGNYTAAFSAYQAALQVDSSNVVANLGLGNLYMVAPNSALPVSTDRYTEAVRAFRAVTAQAPNWSGGYARLGEALAAQNDLKTAIVAFSKSLELDPNGPERWLALAAIYDRDNQPDQARFARERANNLSTIPTATPLPAPTATPVPRPNPTATPKK
jgi:tetratricopeptide (TPR) repeat protein